MTISSTFCRPDGIPRLPVFSSAVNGKTLTVAVVVGELDGNIAAMGNECIRLLAENMDLNGPAGAVHRVGMSNADTAEARISMVMATATDGDGVVFMCESVAIFDAVVPVLYIS